MICFEVFHESIPLCRVFSTILHVLMLCSPPASVSAVLRRIATVGSLPNVCRVCSLHNTKENCKSLLTKCRGSVSLDLCIVPEFSIYSQNISGVKTRFHNRLLSIQRARAGKNSKKIARNKTLHLYFTVRNALSKPKLFSNKTHSCHLNKFE